ncbi:MAG: hypothetical protein R8N23_20730 [Reichenbachiella sp.]|uniref:hypothetical protein n=1 Tax=Reichenbachiella sp. TaxID=2184521 RepID=UPI002967236C|nr:hypothetical protein [Reichenbachiella sp.]MDW3212308.1 hypothetical protein [Reichenbachiella sp.]
MTIQQENQINSSKRDVWFEEFIQGVKVDKLMLDSGTADPDKEAFYQNLVEGNHITVLAEVREKSSHAFVQALVKSYIKEINSRNVSISKLALELGNSSILVWAEINDDDEVTEDNLIMSEAKVNAEFLEYGFHISTTILEKSDGIPVPPHYISVL